MSSQGRELRTTLEHMNVRLQMLEAQRLQASEIAYEEPPVYVVYPPPVSLVQTRQQRQVRITSQRRRRRVAHTHVGLTAARCWFRCIDQRWPTTAPPPKGCLLRSKTSCHISN